MRKDVKVTFLPGEMVVREVPHKHCWKRLYQTRVIGGQPQYRRVLQCYCGETRSQSEWIMGTTPPYSW